MKDALLTNVDFKASELVIQEYGMVQKEKKEYKVLYSFSEMALVYSYAIQNLQNVPLEISLDLSNSVNMIASTPTSPLKDDQKKITKVVQPHTLTFCCHQMVKPESNEWKRSVKISLSTSTGKDK